MVEVSLLNLELLSALNLVVEEKYGMVTIKLYVLPCSHAMILNLDYVD